MNKLFKVAILSICGAAFYQTANAQSLPSGFAFCAKEGEICQFQGTQEVRYGGGTNWKIMVANNGLKCDNTTFGGDPFPNVVKQCHSKNIGPLFHDGTKISFKSDNGLWISRCNGCQDTVNNVMPDSMVLSPLQTEFTMFVVQNAPGGKITLTADTGFTIGYCHNCVVKGAFPDFIGVQNTTADNAYNKFELTMLSNGKYAIKAANGMYLARCEGCSPTLVRGNQVVTAHFPNSNSIYAQWDIEAGFKDVGRTFDQYAWLTAHNAFTNQTDARWSTANQSRSIIGQLDANGVRGLMLDIYDFEGVGANVGTGLACGLSAGLDCYGPGVYMCHGGCWGVLGVHYALPRQTLSDTLDKIGDWLAKNRELKDVVTIFLEDYTSSGSLAKVLLSSRAYPYIFNPYGKWKVRGKGFPTLEYMSQTNQRLIIFTNNGGNKDESLGIAYDQDFNVENYWSIGGLGDNYECTTRWNHIPLNTTESNFKRLFVMNHFRSVPSEPTADTDNKESNLRDRLERCKTASGRLPNFLALDFVGHGGGATVVDSINEQWKTVYESQKP